MTRPTKRPTTGPHAPLPVPSPTHPDATLMSEVGHGCTRIYEVRIENHLDRPLLYQGPNLAGAVAAMAVIADTKPCGGTMTETVTYQSFTSPEHWVGARHDCGCIEFPEMDIEEGMGIFLAMSSDRPKLARACDTARALHAERKQHDISSPEWDAAVTAFYAHLGHEEG